MNLRKATLLNPRAFLAAVLVAPGVSITLVSLPHFRTITGVGLIGTILAADLFGFVSTVLFLGVAFSSASRLKGSRSTYVIAGVLAALAHTVAGLVLVNILKPVVMLLLGFVFEYIFWNDPAEHRLYLIGAKAIGGACAGAVYSVLAHKFRSIPAEA